MPETGRGQNSWQAIIPIAASRFLSLFSVGLGFVCLVWLATTAYSIRLTGQIFLTGSLATVAISIFAGAIADQKSRLGSIRWAWVLRGCGIFLLVAGIGTEGWLVPCLFGYTLSSAVSASLGAGVMDAAFQGAISAEKRTDLAVKLEILRQLGLVCGMGLSGYLLETAGAIAPALLLVATFFAQVAIFEIWLRGYVPIPTHTKQNVVRFWLQGVHSACRDRQLMICMFATSLLHSVAQMTNMLVPAFVKSTLHRDSGLYGLLEASWSAGGGVLLLLVSLQKRPLGKGRLEFILTGAIGVMMIVFAMTRNIAMLVALYAILGGLFSFTRALCDGRMLALARAEEIGRVRSATIMMTSLTGMTVYMSPMLFSGEDAVIYYCIWGGFVAVTGVVAYFVTGTVDQKAGSP